jgi:ParB-like chromosome segregation protein Spo0J
MEIQIWPIDKLVFYARNPRKNDAAVDRMCGSIREFGFKIACLIRSDGEVIDGHLRLKAARKLSIRLQAFPRSCSDYQHKSERTN